MWKATVSLSKQYGTLHLESKARIHKLYENIDREGENSKNIYILNISYVWENDEKYTNLIHNLEENFLHSFSIPTAGQYDEWP